MYEQFYNTISAPYRANPKRTQRLVAADKGLVALFAVVYAAVLIWLAVTQDARLWREVFVPAVSFAALSALRYALNRPRPYETYSIDPIIKKDTQGKSFPGRHVFSAAIIACAIFYVSLGWGIAAFFGMAFIAYVRVVGGVHFPRDVIAGAALGVLCGLVGFFLIP